MPTSFARCALASLLAAVPLAADDGAPDPTFSADGRVTAAWSLGTETWAESTAAATVDGGAVVAGGTGFYLQSGAPPSADLLLARWTNGGILDTSWGVNGRLRLGFDLVEHGFDELLGLFADPDGRLTVLAWTASPSGARPAMIRLTAGGTPDPTFGDGGFLWIANVPATMVSPDFVAAARQSDGKFLFAGDYTTTGTGPHRNLFVLRVHPDGTPDTTFSFDGWATIGSPATTDEFLTAIAADPAGAVVLAYLGDDVPWVKRLHGLGGVDTTFGDSGSIHPPFLGDEWRIEGLVIEPGTRGVLAAGWGLPVSTSAGVLFRLTGEGLFDSAFGTDAGYTFFEQDDGVRLRAIARQGDGRIVVGGRITTAASGDGFFLARTTAQGLLDSSFDGNGVARYEFDRDPGGDDVGRALLLAQGRPLLVGSAGDGSDHTAFAVLRVTNGYLFADGFERGDTTAWPEP